MKKKLATATAAVATSLILAGCGDVPSGSNEIANPVATSEATVTPTATPEPEPEPVEEEPEADSAKELAIVEKAFGRDDDMYWYAVVIDNPNEEYIFDSAGVDVEAIGKDGTILDSDSNYTVLLSGETAVTGTFFDVGSEKIDHIEVRGPTADSATHSPLAETGTFKVSKVKATPDDWSTAISGNIESTFEDQQESVKIVVIGRKDGKIKAAEFTFVDRVPSGGKARFEATSFDAPSGLKWTAYASL